MALNRRNAVLAARITELGLTEAELADRLNDTLRDLTGEPGRATSRYVRLLVEGAVRWPWPSRRDALERVLGAPILQLGFIPRAGRGYTAPVHPPTAAPVPAAGPQEPPSVDLVEVAGGRPVMVDLPPLPTGQVGLTDLDRLAAPLAQLSALRGRYGPAGLAAPAARQAARLAGVHDCVMSARVRGGLYAVTGDWYATAASLAVDAGDQAQALRYLQLALWQAAIARDPLLDAHIGHVMAAHATQAGAHQEAGAAAAAMLRRAAGTPASRWVTAAAHLHAAAAYAAVGGLPRAHRALDRALAAVQTATAAQPPPVWLDGLGTWAVHAGRARAALTVGRYNLATTYGARAADTVPAEQVWQRVLVLLDLAAAYLGARQPEQAAAHAETALNLTRHLVNPFDGGPLTQRLGRVAKGLAVWSEVPRAWEWTTRYRQAMTWAGAGHQSAAIRHAGTNGRPADAAPVAVQTAHKPETL